MPLRKRAASKEPPSSNKRTTRAAAAIKESASPEATPAPAGRTTRASTRASKEPVSREASPAATPALLVLSKGSRASSKEPGPASSRGRRANSRDPAPTSTRSSARLRGDSVEPIVVEKPKSKKRKAGSSSASEVASGNFKQPTALDTIAEASPARPIKEEEQTESDGEDYNQSPIKTARREHGAQSEEVQHHLSQSNSPCPLEHEADNTVSASIEQPSPIQSPVRDAEHEVDDTASAAFASLTQSPVRATEQHEVEEISLENFESSLHSAVRDTEEHEVEDPAPASSAQASPILFPVPATEQHEQENASSAFNELHESESGDSASDEPQSPPQSWVQATELATESETGDEQEDNVVDLETESEAEDEQEDIVVDLEMESEAQAEPEDNVLDLETESEAEDELEDNVSNQAAELAPEQDIDDTDLASANQSKASSPIVETTETSDVEDFVATQSQANDSTGAFPETPTLRRKRSGSVQLEEEYQQVKRQKTNEWDSKALHPNSPRPKSRSASRSVSPTAFRARQAAILADFDASMDAIISDSNLSKSPVNPILADNELHADHAASNAAVVPEHIRYEASTSAAAILAGNEITAENATVIAGGTVQQPAPSKSSTPVAADLSDDESEGFVYRTSTENSPEPADPYKTKFRGLEPIDFSDYSENSIWDTMPQHLKKMGLPGPVAQEKLYRERMQVQKQKMRQQKQDRSTYHRRSRKPVSKLGDSEIPSVRLEFSNIQIVLAKQESTDDLRELVKILRDAESGRLVDTSKLIARLQQFVPVDDELDENDVFHDAVSSLPPIASKPAALSPVRRRAPLGEDLPASRRNRMGTSHKPAASGNVLKPRSDALPVCPSPPYVNPEQVDRPAQTNSSPNSGAPNASMANQALVPAQPNSTADDGATNASMANQARVAAQAEPSPTGKKTKKIKRPCKRIMSDKYRDVRRKGHYEVDANILLLSDGEEFDDETWVEVTDSEDEGQMAAYPKQDKSGNRSYHDPDTAPGATFSFEEESDNEQEVQTEEYNHDNDLPWETDYQPWFGHTNYRCRNPNNTQTPQQKQLLLFRKWVGKYEGKDAGFPEHIRQKVWNLPESEVATSEYDAVLNDLEHEQWDKLRAANRAKLGR